MSQYNTNPPFCVEEGTRSRGTPSTQLDYVRPSFSSGAMLAGWENQSFDVEAAMAQALKEQDPDARPQHFQTTFQEIVFVFTVMMATAATTFLQGVTVINTAAIGQDLNMSASQITWISAAIGLGSGSFMLLFGKTADLFGRKLQLLCGLTFLGFVSLLTAFAPNAMAMDILCGFLGVGTAVISPPAIGTLFAAYPDGKRRNKAAGALGAGNPLGFILGSFGSGVATKIWDWRASFILISIFFFAMTAMAIWTMPSIPRVANHQTTLRRFDYPGTVFTIMGVALFTSALTQTPESGWNSPMVLAPLILGVMFLGVFAYWENIHANPLLDPIVWKNTNYTLCVLCTMFGYMSFVTNQFWIPLYMQEVQHLSPLSIAARMLPQAIAGFLWSYIGQALLFRVPGRIIMAIGGVAYLAGSLLLVFVRPETSYWKFLFPAMIFTVIGADFQFIVANLYVAKQMPTQSALAAGVIQTAYRLSLSVGLAITTAVYGSVQKTPQGMSDVTFPYGRAYLCGVAFAAVGLLFIPFMKLDMAASSERNPRMTTDGVLIDHQIHESPRSAGEYHDRINTENQQNITNEPGQSSFSSGATRGREETYFPRWSWEEERNWTPKPEGYEDRSSNSGSIIYEVCIKCLEERKVTLAAKHVDGGMKEGSLSWV
ncbi:major facilitator superfamily domain-containing protein [Amylocarpus encephaloides]|uniref:Major facilitator superfamily domain-containing protein n=1 Tax=Amylocarpus encephaloides TaxID=45428 RepID=A0A9P8C452_9HELO|nr:major facilitator superfamily domain-containing protein [Amylocarpus encephaloides]